MSRDAAVFDLVVGFAQPMEKDVDFEPYSTKWKQNPYPKFRELRDEAPVHWAKESKVWCISRYDDVVDVLQRTDEFSSRRDFGQRGSGASILAIARFLWGMRLSPWKAASQRMLILEDGPPHSVMRNLVNRGFTPRQIRRWETRIGELVDECLAQIEGRARFDLVEDLAIPVPVMVISEMLGIDPARRHDFKRWSDTIVEQGTGTGMESGMSRLLVDTLVEMKRYLGPIVKQRRAEPRDDLVSILVSSQKGESALSDHEIFMFFLLLLIAGNETTTNLIGNGVDALLQHPEIMQRVANDPSMIPGLIEETLRWDAPVHLLNRLATRDVELHGQTIKRGDPVVVLLASANRDERRFEDPDRFDPSRDTNGHLGFGFGAHFCLGASLARLEARAVFGAFLPRLPEFVRVSTEREFLDSYTIRGRARLELRAA